MRARTAFVRLALCAAVVCLTSTAAFAQLPRPTNPNLVRLGYYFDYNKHGDVTDETWSYTNLFVAVPSMAADLSNPDWQTPLRAQLQKATLNHKAVYLIMTVGAFDNQVWTWDLVLDVAAEFWGQIRYVEIAHEEDMSASEMDTRINDFNANLDARGLEHKEIGATFRRDQIETTNAIHASGLSFVNIEAYAVGPGDPNPQVNVDAMNNYLAMAKDRVRNAGKQIFMTMMAYSQNFTWTNMTTLELLNRAVYMNAWDDPSVIGITMFAYNRADGTRFIPQLQQAHREMGSVMGISVFTSIESPVEFSSVSQPFTVSGWSIDRAAAPGGGPGIDSVNIWAFPLDGSPAMFLGAASYGIWRSNVEAAFGTQFGPSGFTFTASGLAPGHYYILASPHSTVSNVQVKSVWTQVHVQ